MDAGDDKSYDDINVTPMVDLYLVLLLIFIIMTTAGVQGVKVDLPKGSKAPALGGPKGKSVTVNNEGKLFLDTVPVTIAEAASRPSYDPGRDLRWLLLRPWVLVSRLLVVLWQLGSLALVLVVQENLPWQLPP